MKGDADKKFLKRFAEARGYFDKHWQPTLPLEELRKCTDYRDPLEALESRKEHYRKHLESCVRSIMGDRVDAHLNGPRHASYYESRERTWWAGIADAVMRIDMIDLIIEDRSRFPGN